MISEKNKKYLEFIGNYGIHQENRSITSDQIKQLEEIYQCKIEDLNASLLYPYIPHTKGEIVSFEELESYEPKNIIEEEYYDNFWED